MIVKFYQSLGCLSVILSKHTTPQLKWMKANWEWYVPHLWDGQRVEMYLGGAALPRTIGTTAVSHSDTWANTRRRRQAAPITAQTPNCYTACHLPHSSLMVYRSPTTTAYQLPQSLPTVHNLLTATELANGTQIANYHSLCRPARRPRR